MFNDDGTCATCDAHIYYDCTCVSLHKFNNQITPIWNEVMREVDVAASIRHSDDNYRNSVELYGAAWYHYRGTKLPTNGMPALMMNTKWAK